MVQQLLPRRFSAYFSEHSHGKYLFYAIILLYVFGVTVVCVLEPFLSLPCEDVKSELEFENSLYTHSLCNHIRHPVLLFMTKAECGRGRNLLMAVFLGSVIGYERRSSDRPAGIRTMALVSLGSALFTINSTFGFLSGPMAWDASRVSAAIPSGVGFLGGGLIVKSSDTDPVTGERHHLVQGITTAAATWLSAAVGIACGGGLYFAASFATALNLILLRFGPSPVSTECYHEEKDAEKGDQGTERQPLYGGTAQVTATNPTTRATTQLNLRARPSLMA